MLKAVVILHAYGRPQLFKVPTTSAQAEEGIQRMSTVMKEDTQYPESYTLDDVLNVLAIKQEAAHHQDDIWKTVKAYKTAESFFRTDAISLKEKNVGGSGETMWKVKLPSGSNWKLRRGITMYVCKRTIGAEFGDEVVVKARIAYWRRVLQPISFESHVAVTSKKIDAHIDDLNTHNRPRTGRSIRKHARRARGLNRTLKFWSWCLKTLPTCYVTHWGHTYFGTLLIQARKAQSFTCPLRQEDLLKFMK